MIATASPAFRKLLLQLWIQHVKQTFGTSLGDLDACYTGTGKALQASISILGINSMLAQAVLVHIPKRSPNTGRLLCNPRLHHLGTLISPDACCKS